MSTPGPDSPAPAEPQEKPKAPGWVRFLPLLLIAAGLAAAVALGVTDLLSLEALQARRAALQAYVADHPVQSLGLYMLAYFVVVLFSLPGGLVMTLTGGFLFGPWLGGGAAILAATAGACAVFTAARSAFGDVLRRRAGGFAARIAEGVKRNAFSYLLTLRLLPIFPFWAVNLGAGFVEVSLRTFALSTLIGIVPGTLIYAGLGSGLSAVFEQGRALDLGVIFEPRVLLPLVGLAALSLIPVIVGRLRRRGAAA